MFENHILFGIISTITLNFIPLTIQQIGPTTSNALTAADFAFGNSLTNAQVYTRHKLPQQTIADVRNPTTSKSPNRKKRMEALLTPGEIWPNARVPYELSTEYTPTERAFIARGFSEFEKRTCVRFVPKTAADEDYIYVGKIDECSSELGKLGGRQELSLDSGCATDYPSIIHETMHALGFLHEHQRNDRDQFIRILWQNIIPASRAPDYYKAAQSDPELQFSNYGEPYDYASIMHYSRDEDNEQGQDVIEALVPGYTALIGTGTDFSASDIIQINRMYKCPQAG